MNTLINSHAPLKKLNKKQRKFQQKPWITKGIQNAIEKKNRLFKKYIKCGDSNKNIFHEEYKTYRNSLSTLLKQSKKSYYNNYFRNNINIKNTWKGIKSIISFKVVSATFLLVCFIYLKESACYTRKNAFYFTSKALRILEIINF